MLKSSSFLTHLCLSDLQTEIVFNRCGSLRADLKHRLPQQPRHVTPVTMTTASPGLPGSRFSPDLLQLRQDTEHEQNHQKAKTDIRINPRQLIDDIHYIKKRTFYANEGFL